MAEIPPLRTVQRALILFSSLGGWWFAGVIMAVPPLAARVAVASMGITSEAMRGRWFSWFICAFLLGAACGGFVFGWLGDRYGRSRALGWSICTYSFLAGACYFAKSPEQMLVLWFLACTGVGGAWPNGISLASEALPKVSRPWLAGVFGTTANLGLMTLSSLAYLFHVNGNNWRWVMLVAASPAVLGLVVLFLVPESPRWLEEQQTRPLAKKRLRVGVSEVFRPPLLGYTIIGILLGAVPLIGNWGASNWLVPWSNQVEEQVGKHGLSAATQWVKSGGATLGSLLGGWLASQFGRRSTYFLVSLVSLSSSFYIFHNLSPMDGEFLVWVFFQGFVGTIYFGWLPLYLPELFPTRVRATGTGVTFNWGRLATAVTVLVSGQLMLAFHGNYARVGQWTCLVYVLGMLVICFAPDTTSKDFVAIRDRIEK
ncbi:MFS transporter [Planctomicrobium sp. SH661]|uniref:MFS transporter n=1 Tax=Planctomicrobium sp. SH661 TaxID=3448124 RepID=UPI003F5C411E